MDILTVSQCLTLIQNALGMHEILGFPITVRGEISGFKVIKGHAYFSIKDQAGLIKAVYFSIPSALSSSITDGNVVDATGQFKLYFERGDLQLYVKSLQLQTKFGLLQLRFEELKRKLIREGVIPKPPEECRALPMYPRKIGVVASAKSAAFADIVRTLQKRYPVGHILLFHTGVQGDTAIDQIVHAITQAERSEADAVIVARGGGSIEDLWCFNEERVVRAIRQCKKPIIVGVGHEIDHTLSEYAADYIASTPTAAAVQASPDISLTIERYGQKMQHTKNMVISRLAEVSAKAGTIRRLLRFYRPDQMLLRDQQRLEEIKKYILSTGKAVCDLTDNQQELMFEKLTHTSPQPAIEKSEWILSGFERGLSGLDPSLVLNRGYAWVEKHGKITSSVVEFVADDELTIRLKDGRVEANVTRVIREKENGNGQRSE
jgi:exodeoxyribonuclease VII large subunit